MWPNSATNSGAPSLTVGRLLPFHGEAYARVFHPARLFKNHWPSPKLVRWSEVAAYNNTVFHPGAEWGSLVKSWKLRGQDGVWDDRPSYGRLDLDTARELEKIITAHYGPGYRFQGALWEGRAYEEGISAQFEGAPSGLTKSPTSSYSPTSNGLTLAMLCHERAGQVEFGYDDLAWLGLSGTLEELLQTGDPEPDFREPASMIWPQQGDFSMITWIDLLSTYVSGPRSLIDSLIGSSELECLEVPFEQSVTWDSDSINPPVPPPY